ncbi:MAG: hypothetical protein K2L39_05040 [Muribaculaceae bacterium]|nr:hypothetical protein [Muribaculaceae bacterium]
MKKILLLMVGAIVALVTHAQDYSGYQAALYGDFNGWSGSAKVNGEKGVFTWSDVALDGNAFQVRLYHGDVTYYRSGGEISVGDWQNFSSTGGNSTLSNHTSGAKYDVVYDEHNKKIKITVAGGGSGTETPTTTYKLHGQLTGDSSWATEDMTYNDGNWEYTGNLVAGEFGLKKFTNGNESWIGGGASVTEANKAYELSGSNNSSSTLAGKYTIVYNPKDNTIIFKSSGVGDAYTFALFNGDNKLYDFTGSNPYEVKYTISAPLSEGMPLCVKRIKNGNVENTYGLANAATYDGTKLDNAALQQDGEALVLAATLEGAVTFTLNVTDNVPASLTVSGGQLHQEVYKDFYLIGKFNEWNLKDEAYKFETTDGKVYTYTVGEAGINGVNGWKINDGTWNLDFARNSDDPHVEYNVLYNLKQNTGESGNFERDIPAGAVVTFTYNPGGTSTLLIATNGGGSDIPVNKPTTLYIQMKYDYANQAADAPKTEDDPVLNPVRCHVYNSVTGEHKSVYGFGSDEEKMDRVSFRYSLWKYELTEEDLKKYDAVDFYIYSNNDNGTYKDPIEYRSNIAVYTDKDGKHEFDVDWYDKENWTQFIYATATLAGKSPNPKDNPCRYACQSMLSFEDFNAMNERDEANGGRSFLYLVGWGVTFDAEDANGNVTEKDPKSMPGTPATAYALPADNGCFYLPTYKPGKDDEGKFKVSFVNTAEASKQMSRLGGNAKTLADKYDPASQGCPRHWATFDLGLVGVDTRFDYTKFPGSWQPTYDSGEPGSPGSVNMEVNRSVKYNNVNQGDWIVPKNTPKEKNYFVFDSHEKCMSVSFIDFDPHPSIVANSCDVQSAQLSQAEAISLHNHGLHLDGAGANGHVYVQNVNYVHGNVNISAAVGNNLSDEGRYKSSYSLLLDGRELSSSLDNGSGSYDIAFLPVSADCNLQIRGKYTNNFNGLTFHSRTSSASLTTHIELAAPAPVDCDGQYVVNKNIANDGETYTYGVFVKEGLSFQIEGSTDRYYYADFNLADAEIVDSKHYLTKYNVCEGITEWVKNLDAEGADWFENGQNNDWSSIMKDGMAMPLYLPAVATAADVDELEAKVIEGEIKAVYPFLIDPEAKLVPVGSKAPNRAATSNGGASITVDGKVMSYVPMPAKVKINVLADNVISGVANVAVDAVAEGDVEYYSISGVRVYGEPAPGIYLRRQGNTVSKVVIR